MKKIVFLGLTAWLYFTYIKPIMPVNVKVPALTKETIKLVERTKTGSQDERVLAIQECGGGRYTICYYSLVELLEDPDPVIREQSAHALGLLRIPESLDHISRVLEVEDEVSVKVGMIRSLGLLGIEESWKIVEPYLSSGEASLRRVSAMSLGLIEAAESFDSIVAALESEGEERVKVELICSGLLVRPDSTELMSLLIKNLFSQDRMTRYRSAQVAGEIRAQETLKALERAIMFETDQAVREELIKAYVSTLEF